jgi:hypothetical protein
MRAVSEMQGLRLGDGIGRFAKLRLSLSNAVYFCGEEGQKTLDVRGVDG